MKSALPLVKGFQSFHNSRLSKGNTHGRLGGGVAVYFHESLAQYISVCDSAKDHDRIWFKIDASLGLMQDLYVCNCYFPPQGSSHYQDLDNPFLGLDEEIQMFKSRGNTLLAGDFNASTGTLQDFQDDSSLIQYIPTLPSFSCDIPTRSNSDTHVNNFGRHLLALTAQHDLVICNGRLSGDLEGEFTHRAYNTGSSSMGGFSLVDYFIADQTLFLHSLHHLHVRQPVPESDHHPISLILTLDASSRPQKAHTATPFSVNLNDINKAHFLQALSVLLPQDFSQESLTSQEAGVKLQSIIMEAAKGTIMQKKANHAVSKPSKSWYDHECKQLRTNYRSLLQSNASSEVISSAQRAYKIMTRKKRRSWEDAQSQKLYAVA